MTGEGIIVAGTGVDVDIVPPSSVKVGNAWAAELAGMTNELKCKLAISQRSNWGSNQN
jgi:hypothetical protein